METYIIHRSVREDRKVFVDNLKKTYTNSKIFEGFVPQFPSDSASKAVRGCSMSHLGVLKNHLKDEPILVLEDDAVIERNLPELTNIPDDCASIIVGGDVEYVEDGASWFKIIPPFFGTQAVIYLPKFKECLLTAYEMAGIFNLGWGPNTICLESL